jgi:MurNAc alpha-1-phosphate uridylyltransferase
MENKIDHAFVLAAGFGTRMMPLTATQPKPMVKVFDVPMIGHILDHLKAAGVTHVTVNGHYKPEVLEAYLKTRDDLDITFAYEEGILDTGGGLVNALDTMPKDQPFYIINGDAYWDSSEDFVLTDLAKNWDESKMDILLLLQQKEQVREGNGDYHILSNGQAKRALDRAGTHMFTGIRLCHPRVFEGQILRKFSFLECMDKAQNEGRLFGMENKGLWHHLSTPEDISDLEGLKASTAAK